MLELSDGDLPTRLTQALAARGVAAENPDAKLGLAVVVGLVNVSAVRLDAPKPTLLPELLVAVLSNPITNRPPSGSGKRPANVVQHVVRALHWYPTVAGLRDADRRHRYRLAGEPAVRLLDDEAKQRLFGLSGGIGYAIGFCAEAPL